MDTTEAERIVDHAICLGYRLIDTAQHYRNEAGVGRGVQASGIPRRDVFITTKFNLPHGRQEARDAFECSAERLGTDYIDLLLIHWPNPGHGRYVEAWEGMIELLEATHVRAIGTSNFKEHHLQRLINETSVSPHVNQIQVTPITPRTALRAFVTARHIHTQSWSPLDGIGGGGNGAILTHETITGLAQRHNRSPAQIVLRWNLQQEISPIVKSSNPYRLRQNLDIFDFTLPPEHVKLIESLDVGHEKGIIDSDAFGH